MTKEGKSLAEKAERFAFRLNWINERVCAALVATMILIVWFGIIERYILGMGAIWTEELARYVMIWAALMAIPCCAYRREHIALDLIFCRLPENCQRPARVILDCIGLAFFTFLLFYSFPMVQQGETEYATIFGMTMVVPFLSVTVSCLFTVIQIAATMIREYTGTTPLCDADKMYTQ